MIEYKYCPQDKTLLDISGEYPHCPACGITIYKNSKPTAGILPIKNGQVLLSKRGIEPFKGEFDIIGGFLNNGEHPEVGAIREAKEETGLDIKVTMPFGIYMDTYGKDGEFTQNTYYLGEILGGEMSPHDDVSSLHWINIDQIPTNEGFENTKQVLSDLRKFFSK